MGKKIKVNFRDILTKEFDSEVSLLEVSEAFKNNFDYPIMAAKVDNDICDLSETISKKLLYRK